MVVTASDALRAYIPYGYDLYAGHPALIDTDRRDSMKKFGCGLMGMPTVSQKLLVGGQRVPTLAAIRCDQGLLDRQTVLETVSGCRFRSSLIA